MQRSAKRQLSTTAGSSLLTDETPAFSDPRLKSLDHKVVRHGRVGSLSEAAELRGVPPSAVIKTMVIRKADDDYLFILVPGDRVIDWPKLRAHLGQRRVSMPDADEALNVTGYVRGTITPFGAAHPLPVIADTMLSSGTVSIGGGAPGVSFTVGGAELCLALDADVADVTAERMKE
jgi:Cys-tRNA(Pro)/Cys-tRNA(Cys) deacylase